MYYLGNIFLIPKDINGESKDLSKRALQGNRKDKKEKPSS